VLQQYDKIKLVGLARHSRWGVYVRMHAGMGVSVSPMFCQGCYVTDSLLLAIFSFVFFMSASRCTNALSDSGAYRAMRMFARTAAASGSASWSSIRPQSPYFVGGGNGGSAAGCLLQLAVLQHDACRV